MQKCFEDFQISPQEIWKDEITKMDYFFLKSRKPKGYLRGKQEERKNEANREYFEYNRN